MVIVVIVIATGILRYRMAVRQKISFYPNRRNILWQNAKHRMY